MDFEVEIKEIMFSLCVLQPDAKADAKENRKITNIVQTI
jgi:hypothetical protein